jgi:hypothetical protein
MTYILLILTALSCLSSYSVSAAETHISCIDKNNNEEIFIKFEESLSSAFDYCYSDSKRGVTPEDNYIYENYEMDGNALWMLVAKYPSEIAVDIFDYVGIMNQPVGSSLFIEIDSEAKLKVKCHVISRSAARISSPCLN